jgi:hypothetical protein
MSEDERIQYLLSQLLDGDPSDSEMAELNQLLKSDRVGRDLLIDHLLIDSLLSEEVGAEPLTALVDLVAGNNHLTSVTGKKWYLPRIPGGKVYGTIAALLLIAFFAGIFFSGSSYASARTWLVESRRIHQLAFDRCYVVDTNIEDLVSKNDVNAKKTDIDPKRRPGRLARAVGRVDRLWTRGDQFYIESSNDKHRWVWGMDGTGAVWLTLDSKLGLKLEPNEVPPWMETLTDTLSMRIDTLLDEVLMDFELSWEPSEAQSSTRTVKATAPRNRLRRIREVRLEIDRETKVVLKISIDRINRMDARTTTVFTLAATEAQPDSRYQIEGHLEERSVILTNKNQPERRAELITRLFGQSP